MKQAMIFVPPHLHDAQRWRGLRIGLMGGSFNPPHQGHVHIAQLAARALRLDAVWWLVTPHNPLKAAGDLMDYETRLRLCRDITRTMPEMVISDLEARMGTNKTADTIRALRRHYPATSFVMITGMDNAQTLHLWHDWRDILARVATAHIARPPAWTLVRDCPLRRVATQNHVFVARGMAYPLRPHTSFWLLQSPLRDISSTKIRNLNKL